MKFQILSDIHLEHYDTYPGIKTFISDVGSADYLCLCGDIGAPFEPSYKRFLEECADGSWKKVFVIAGNHEMYGKRLKEVYNHINTLCNQIDSNKLVFLQNTGFDVSDNIRVIGATLWSEIDYDEHYSIGCFIADFRKIKDFTTNDYGEEYVKTVKFIQKELSNNPNKNFVILTHHVPLLTCGSPKYLGSPLSSAYRSNLRHLMTDQVLLWAYGHDHYSMRVKVENTLVVSNQFGYPGEIMDHKDTIIDIE